MRGIISSVRPSVSVTTPFRGVVPRGVRYISKPVDSIKSTAPLKVQERRALFPETHGRPLKFTPSQEIKFQTARAEGKFPGEEKAARQQFLDQHNMWRSRVRGHRNVKKMPDDMDKVDESLDTVSSAGKMTLYENPFQTPAAESLVAHRIYLPNITVQLVRNVGAPGGQYDPMIATFRIPLSMNKNDLRSYLLAVYGLHVTFIRTDIRIGSIGRTKKGKVVREGGPSNTYKRAIVGLYEPFHFPDDLAELDAIIHQPVPSTKSHPELSATELQAAQDEVELRRKLAKEGKASRDAWLEQNYQRNLMETYRKMQLFKMAKGTRWRNRTHDNRVRTCLLFAHQNSWASLILLGSNLQGNIVREIMAKRKEREEAIQKATEEAMKAAGIDFTTPPAEVKGVAA